MNPFDNHEAHVSDSRDHVSARNHSASEVTAAGVFRPSPPIATTPSPLSPRHDLGPTERPTLTVEETANLLGISRWLVQQAVGRGELPFVRIGRRILIPRARLQAMLAGQSEADVQPASDRDPGANVGQNCPTPAPQQLLSTWPNSP